MPYEFDGEQYQKVSAHQKEWGRQLISELNLVGDEHILDLGCGDGVLTEALVDLVPNGRVKGIDASQGMIDAATKKTRHNLTFELLDINTLELPEHYDIIFSNAALHWVKDHRKLWKNIVNILSDKGIARFNFAADGNCSSFFNIVKKTIAQNEYKHSFENFEWPWYMPRIDEYKQILEPYSFTKMNVWGENADRVFPNRESIVGWIDQPSLVPFLDYITDDQKESFRNTIVEQMLDVTSRDNGTYFETFRRIHAHIQK